MLWVFEGGQSNGVLQICPRLALDAMVAKIWDSMSNNEIIVRSTAKGLDKHRVQQNVAYPVLYDNFGILETTDRCK